MRRRTRAKRQTWRSMDAQARPIGVLARLGLCLAVVVVACGLLMLFSAHQPAVKLLQRWLPGIAAIFAVLLAALFAVVFRGWLGRSLLAIPVGALLSYAAAPLAFHLHGALLDTARWWTSVSTTNLWTTLVLTVAVWPSFLLAWLFAAVAAGLYLAAGAVLELRGIAVTMPETVVGGSDDADDETDQGSASPSEASTRATAGRDATRSDNRAQAG